jgi:hypothetical protein
MSIALVAGVGMLCLSSSLMVAMIPSNKDEVSEPEKKSTEESTEQEQEQEQEPSPSPARSRGDQSWRDDNPGAVIADVSTGCVTPKTFDASVTYDGPSNDNYYNYCHEMVLSQSSKCKKELCANNNVYGACRNECDA